MTESEMSPVDKHFNCQFSCSVSAESEDAIHELADRGIQINYCCEHHDIVASRRFPVISFTENGQRVYVATIYGVGSSDDPRVLEAITKSCEACPYLTLRN